MRWDELDEPEFYGGLACIANHLVSPTICPHQGEASAESASLGMRAAIERN